MKRTSAKTVIILATLLAVAFGAWAYFQTGYWQSLLLGLARTSLSLAIGLVVVNVYLKLQEKRQAAVPLFKMIVPSISAFHNDYFIEQGRLKFGTPDFNTLLRAYQTNKRDPKALSPAQRTGLYEIIEANRDEVVVILDKISDQLKEMSFILGWSFSPRIMRASLDCRLIIVEFKALDLDGEEQTKLDACELYLDIDATSGAVVATLAELLGLKDDEWKS